MTGAPSSSAIPDPAWRGVRRLLAIRLDNLGDVLMTTPALAAVRDSLPGVHLSLLASASGCALAPHLPLVDEVIPFDAPWVQSHGPGDDEQALAERLRAGRFDAAIVFTVCTQSPLPAALLCRLAGIPLRLAHCRENPYKLLSHWVREQDVPSAGMRHEVQRQLDLVASVGFRPRSERLQLHYSAGDAHRLRVKLAEAGARPGQPYFVVHPGATAASRRYPAQRFAEAADALAASSGCTPVFCGGSGDTALVAQARAAMRSASVDLSQQLSLGELAALIAGARVTLCNNSAPAHMAAALQAPAVVLYALTNPQHTPWRSTARVLNHDVPCRNCLKSICPEGHHACLEGVSAQAVVDAATELIGTPPAVPLPHVCWPAMPAPAGRSTATTPTTPTAPTTLTQTTTPTTAGACA